jgi:sterol 3beta-glucosyltransferase
MIRQYPLMRVGLQSWGTEGDIRPFFALARALEQRGHEVRLLYTNVEGRDLSELGRGLGGAVTHVGAAYLQAQRERLDAQASENLRIRNPITQLERIFAQTMDPVADEMFQASRELAAWADLAVLHFLAHPAATAAEEKGRPFAWVAFAPVHPTRTHPPIGAPRLGAWGNAALWSLADRAMESILARRVNAVRATAGLPPVRRVVRALRERACGALLAISPAIYPRPADFPDRLELCGFLELPHDPGALEPELRDFLDAGPPPAFFTLGSMGALLEEHAEHAALAMSQAAARLQLRTIVQVPPAVAARLQPAEHTIVLSRADHARVFPRCAVIVHHGGAGTTHAALRAGRPSVVVPHLADQFFWADLLHRRGVAAPPLRRSALTPARLEARLAEILRQPAFTTTAETLAASLTAEPGPAKACELLERFAASPRA